MQIYTHCVIDNEPIVIPDPKTGELKPFTSRYPFCMNHYMLSFKSTALQEIFYQKIYARYPRYNEPDPITQRKPKA